MEGIQHRTLSFWFFARMYSDMSPSCLQPLVFPLCPLKLGKEGAGPVPFASVRPLASVLSAGPIGLKKLKDSNGYFKLIYYSIVLFMFFICIGVGCNRLKLLYQTHEPIRKSVIVLLWHSLYIIYCLELINLLINLTSV